VALILEREDLAALCSGFTLLGSGGGGSPHLAALTLDSSSHWPISVHDIGELDPARPCVAVGYAGATLLMEERLPGTRPFDIAIAAVERWLGSDNSVVCMLEGAGINGLASLHLAESHDVVDADCMGRALPDLDQTTVLVDGLPGIVAAVPTGSGGVALVHHARPPDLERVIRNAIICNGGWAGVALGGFSVADLSRHAISGALRRARALGENLLGATASSPAQVAKAVGGDLLGVGRVVEVRAEPGPSGLSSFDVRTAAGDVVRLVAGSEFLAVVANGSVVAASPTVIVVLDAASRTPLEVDEVGVAKDLIVLSMPAPAWWHDKPHRLNRVNPAHWGIEGLEER
jgi:DUF917 family protein